MKRVPDTCVLALRVLTILAFLTLGAGCGDSSPVMPSNTKVTSPAAPPPDAPVVTGISPATAVAGSPDLSITVTGTNFVQKFALETIVRWTTGTRPVSHTYLATKFISSSEVTAVVPAALLASEGTAMVSVINGDSIGLSDGFTRYPTSNGVTFTVRPATPIVLGTYAATFTASASCASELPPGARQRTYTMTIRSTGDIQWTGPTVHPPSGHRTVSSWAFTGDVFSFSVDTDHDPQSDDFHGIWDDMGNGTVLNISGKGAGTVHGDEITGTLNGLIAFYQPVVPAQPGVLIEGHYCQAVDHAFSFVRQ